MSLCGVSKLLQATLRANNNWSGYADQGACKELAIQDGRAGAMKDWPILPCHYLLWSLQLYPGAKRSNTDIWQNDWKGKYPWENLPGIQVILFLTGLVAHSHTNTALCQAEVVEIRSQMSKCQMKQPTSWQLGLSNDVIWHHNQPWQNDITKIVLEISTRISLFFMVYYKYIKVFYF